MEITLMYLSELERHLPNLLINEGKSIYGRHKFLNRGYLTGDKPYDLNEK